MAPVLDSAIIAAITVTLSLGIVVVAVAASRIFLRSGLGREVTTPRLVVVATVWMIAVLTTEAYQTTGSEVIGGLIIPVLSLCTAAAALSYWTVLLKSPGGAPGVLLSLAIAAAELIVVVFGNVFVIMGVDMAYLAMGGKFN
jgi:hypothetical protein